MGQVSEAGQVARYELHYRAPNRMLAKLTAPAERTLAFDGQTLFDVEPAAKRFTATPWKERAPQEGAQALNALFAPFVPDGFRAPLVSLSPERTRARFVSHPRAPRAVELTTRAQEGDAALEVTYVLRYPALDFLSRSSRSGTARAELTVEEEQCDEKLHLCVPKRLLQTNDGQKGALTELSLIELQAALPVDAFTLQAPPASGGPTPPPPVSPSVAP